MNKGLPVLLTMTILSGIDLSSTFVSADTEVIDRVELTVPIACTMSGTGTTHTATLNPGTYSATSGSDYEAGIGKTTLTAICNDDHGFSIYAIGFTGNQYEGDNRTKLVGPNTNGNIATKAYVSGDATSNWSMKLTKVTNPGSGDPITYNPENLTITTNYDNWIAVPATYTKVAQYKANTGSSTTDTTLGVKLETTYAAYIASNQAADTYVGQVKYTIVHPYNDDAPLFPQQATAGCINYFPNGNNVVGTMGCQSATDGNNTILLASNFSRTGYGFAGWSDKFDYTTNSAAHFYGPQETITVPEGTTANGLSLYAVWIPSAGSIQDSSKVSKLCGTGQGSLTTAPTDGTASLTSVSALTDQRDNQTYAIAKLADGNCWIIENLRLEAENTRSAEDIALSQGYVSSDVYGSFVGLADPEPSTNFAESATANSIYYSGSQEGTAYIDIGASNNPAYRMPRYNNTNTSSRDSYPTNYSAKMYSYGNSYTWSAAIADTTVHSNDSANTSSICPTNWGLPSSQNLAQIDTALGGTGTQSTSSSTPTGTEMSMRYRKYPNNFLISDYASSRSFGSSAGALNISSNRITPGTYLGTITYKYKQLFIRCTNKLAS